MKRVFGFTILAIITALCAWYFVLTRPSVNSQVPFDKELIAKYDGFAFAAGPDAVESFITGLFDDDFSVLPVARIYVRDKEHGTILLSELTQNIGREIAVADHWRTGAATGNEASYLGPRSLLKFRDNRLIHATLDAADCPFELSPSPDGPFVRLPISRQKMVEIFGKPRRWYFANRVTGP